jgi:hypothetical protein
VPTATPAAPVTPTPVQEVAPIVIAPAPPYGGAAPELIAPATGSGSGKSATASWAWWATLSSLAAGTAISGLAVVAMRRRRHSR